MLILALGAAGCGGQSSRLRTALGSLDGRVTVGAVALSPHDLVVATVRGPVGVETTGGEIAVSHDGGRLWRVVLSAPNIHFYSLARAGRTLIAVGAPYTAGDGAAETAPGAARLWTSSDGGARWSTITPTGPSTPDLWGDTVWPAQNGRVLLAFPSVAQAEAPPALSASAENTGVEPGTLMRSTDGGRTWRSVSLPELGDEADGSASWVGDTVWVSGVADPACEGLWRSTDFGAHFRTVAETCPADPDAGGVVAPDVVDFLSARDGVRAGGRPEGSGVDPGPAEFVDMTTDGGRLWRRVWSLSRGAGDYPLGVLVFTNAHDGWALPVGASDTTDPFAPVGDLLHTGDGGRTWTDSDVAATGLAVLPGSGTALSFLDPSAFARALSPVTPDGNLSLTADGGAAWTDLTPSAVQNFGMLGGAGGWLRDLTSAGDFLSTDGGRSWHPQPRPRSDSEAVAVTRGLSVDQSMFDTPCVVFNATNPGGPWAAHPQSGPDDVCENVGVYAYASPTRGFNTFDQALCGTDGGRLPDSATLASRDGGITWRADGAVPGSSGLDAELAADGTVLLVTEQAAAPSACHEAAVSVDGGRHWRISHFQHDCEGDSAADGRLWLACGSEVLQSADDGLTWSAEPAPRDGAASIWATGPQSLIVSDLSSDAETEDDPAGSADGRRYWHSTDEGRRWAPFSPALPLGPDHPAIASFTPGGAAVGEAVGRER
jgi:photosystem II stability/assembly factor-like uncharacterized protein